MTIARSSRPVPHQLVRPVFLAGLAVAALCGVATAQQQSDPRRPPNMPPPATTVPEKIDPPLQGGPGADDTTGTLSDKLNKSDGVIRPPAGVDPEMRVPAPEGNTGRMPVIPPPGEPGGNPSVQPK